MVTKKATPKTPAVAPRSRIPWHVVLIVCALTLLLDVCICADSQMLGGPFVLDDVIKISENLELRQFGMALMSKPDPNRANDVFAYNDPSRPFVTLTYQANYYFTGLDTKPFRFFNFVIHWINGILVFFLVDAFAVAAELPGHGSPYTFKTNIGPLLASLLFVVSPMNHSTALYLFARSDLMGATGLLVYSVIGLRTLIARRQHASGTWRPLWSLGMFTSLLFALFSKQLSVSGPVALGFVHLVLIESLPKRADDADIAWFAKNFLGMFCRTLFIHVLWIAALAAYLIFRIIYFGSAGDFEKRLALTEAPLTPEQEFSDNVCYWASQPYAFWRYGATMLLQRGITIDHGVLASEWCGNSIEWASGIAAGFLFLALLFSVVVRAQTRGPRESLILAGFGWFGIQLLPASVALTTTVYAERRAYLASAGVYGVIALASLSFGSSGTPSSSSSKRSNVHRALATSILVFFVSYFLLQSRALNAVYYNEEALWREMLRQYPDSIQGHGSLASALLTKLKEQGAAYCPDCADGVRYHAKFCLQKNPLSYDEMMTLGDLEKEVGNPEASRMWFEKVIEIAPLHAVAHFKVATNIHRKEGATKEALKHYKIARKQNPSQKSLHNNLALCYLHMGKKKDARKMWKEGIAMYPGDELLLSNKRYIFE